MKNYNKWNKYTINIIKDLIHINKILLTLFALTSTIFLELLWNQDFRFLFALNIYNMFFSFQLSMKIIDNFDHTNIFYLNDKTAKN